MSKKQSHMNRRNFLKSSAAFASITFLPSSVWSAINQQKLRTAHIGVGGQGSEDLRFISSHPLVEVAALCDVDSNNLEAALNRHPDARTFSDYRVLFKEMGSSIDAVIISTPDHTHAPASMMAMEMGKPVYCQKPLTHFVSEARDMASLAEEKGLVSQMGIQVHSFYDYKLATLLIQSGIIGKVHTVRAWSNKSWGYDGPETEGSDPVPENLDWNLWQGTAPERLYKEELYHPVNWRKFLDYGCSTLGDMGVHIFDTPYNALALDVPDTVMTSCRPPTGYGHPERNVVTYSFPGTPYTARNLEWIWYDGRIGPDAHEDLVLPDNDRLPQQGAMFLGEKGRLLLPHFMQLPSLIVDGKYESLDMDAIEQEFQLGTPVRNYATEGVKHYHQFVDACMGNAECSAPFSYASRLTETILLGVIANRFPDRTLHWLKDEAQFRETEVNPLMNAEYREF